MKITELFEDGVIVPGVNTTPDVKPGETERQAKKFFGGNGKPKPLGVKGATPNQAFNLGLAENMSVTGTERRRLEKKKGIKIGTPEWFKHWFDLPYLREDITRDELMTRLKDQQRGRYIRAMLDAMHKLVQSKGAKHSLGSYAFEIGKVFGFDSRELEKMYRDMYISEVNEAFDNPYPYTWDSTHDKYAEFGNDSFLAKSEMDMGDELMVMFTLGKPGVSWTIDFAVDGAMDKTGDGDQFRIFATVVAVIKDWMANKVDLSKVTQIDFSADKDGAAEDSRSKLYKRFGQQLASKLGWNLEIIDRGQFASFKIKNPNAPVEEAVNEATEMKISDLTISDAGMAIAQSAGGGSKTDAPLTVTKLPSGHVYLVNGYHRLVDAMKSGKDTVAVEYVPYEKVEILWKQEREDDIKYGKQFNEEVEVSLHGDAKKGYVLSKIEVSGDERNAGQGTKAMQDIVDRMDKEGAIIALTPDDAFGGNKNRLIKFYKRFGFVPNKGRNKDFRFRETMIRYPQSNESVNEAFDNPYPFELIGPNDAQEFSALAQTPNGMLRMDFSSIDYDNFGIDFSVGTSMGKTEAGDEFRVFATVVAIMKKWIKTVGIESVESFEFGASKADHASDGRAKLYTRFAKQLASRLGWKLEQNTAKDDGTVFFKLTNPNPVLRDDEYWDALDEVTIDNKNGRGAVPNNEDVTQPQLNALEKAVDKVFGQVGIDVEFTRHFLDRANDARNGEPISIKELAMLFKKEYQRWGKPIAQMGPNAQAVLKDLESDINVPFVLQWDRENNELDMIAKTVMRKKDFRTSNKEFPVEALTNNVMQRAHQQLSDTLSGITKKHNRRSLESKVEEVFNVALENFADGKKKGKSRPGRVKRSGASCDGSVTELRKKAKNSSGERAKMYHWCANMKSGRKKSK